MNNVSVMQPYLFPYVGYFQLINSIDKFVFYDDVNYIKQGWINRNKVLVNGKETLFTVPLKKASSFSKINEIEIHPNLYNKWKNKFYKTLSQSYQKSDHFNKVFPIVEKVFDQEYDSISGMAINSIKSVTDYLGFEKEFYISSKDFPDTAEEDRSDRLIKIVGELCSDNYINNSGGKELYDKTYFKNNGVNLLFIEPELSEYKQDSESFIKGLSIIDVLMNNSKEEIKEILNKYELV